MTPVMQAATYTSSKMLCNPPAAWRETDNRLKNKNIETNIIHVVYLPAHWNCTHILTNRNGKKSWQNGWNESSSVEGHVTKLIITSDQMITKLAEHIAASRGNYVNRVCPEDVWTQAVIWCRTARSKSFIHFLTCFPVQGCRTLVSVSNKHWAPGTRQVNVRGILPTKVVQRELLWKAYCVTCVSGPSPIGFVLCDTTGTDNHNPRNLTINRH